MFTRSLVAALMLTSVRVMQSQALYRSKDQRGSTDVATVGGWSWRDAFGVGVVVCTFSVAEEIY
jgi:hypothetical protein